MKGRYRDFLIPNFDTSKRVYIDSPTFRGFPLGGVGNGGISIYADGDFSEVRTNRNWFLPIRDLRGTFFAVSTRKKGEVNCAKILRRTHHNSKEFRVDNIAHTEFKGEIPRFALDFDDDTLPVRSRLTGFSPLIPHNIKDSSLPVAIFEMEIKNPTDDRIDVSALFSWQNVLGITGTGGSPLIWKDTFKSDYSRFNYATRPDGGIKGVKFLIDKDFEEGDSRRRGIGECLIFTEPEDGHEITFCHAWDEKKKIPHFWDDFRDEGRIGDYHDFDFDGKSKMKKSGAVCVRFEVGPGEEKKIPFYLVWLNPYYVLQKGTRKKIGKKIVDGIDHGVYASNFFDSVEEIGMYAAAEKERLLGESLELQRVLKDETTSDIPDWLIDVIINSADSLITNSVLTKEKELFTIEGMDWQLFHRYQNTMWPFGGLTGTNDQRLSSHPYTSVFFPELDKSELLTFRDLAVADNGKVPHGNGGAEIALADSDTPYSKPIPWINNGKNDWPDLTCSLILQLGKLIKITGDLDLLFSSWDAFLSMSDYLTTLVKDDVPEGSSTYDVFAYEPCFLYNATLYVAANRMLAELSRHIPSEVDGNAETREEIFTERGDNAFKTYNERLWQGDSGYFKVSAKNENLFQGGLAGDWIARYSGMSPVVEPKKALSHSLWQDKILVDASLSCGKMRVNFGGRPLPYNEATIEGKEIPLKMFGIKKIFGANYIYQAISYQAFESIYLGNVKEGIKLIKMVYDKVYEEGYPWDMNLMGLPGFVYMTHPVMWAFFNAMSGGALDLLTGTIYLAPRLFSDMDKLKMPVFFPNFWLSVDYDRVKRVGMVKVIKVIKDAVELKERPESMKNNIVLSRLVLNGEDDEIKKIELGGFIVKEGASFPFSM